MISMLRYFDSMAIHQGETGAKGEKCLWGDPADIQKKS